MWCIIYSLTKQVCRENFHARCGNNIESITKTCTVHHTPVQSHRMCIWVLLCLKNSLRPFIRMRSYLPQLIKSIYQHERLQTSGELIKQFSPTKNKHCGTKHSKHSNRRKTQMLTFDPAVTSTAPEDTALGDSVTMPGDLWLAADLDMGESILKLKKRK